MKRTFNTIVVLDTIKEDFDEKEFFDYIKNTKYTLEFIDSANDTDKGIIVITEVRPVEKEKPRSAPVPSGSR